MLPLNCNSLLVVGFSRYTDCTSFPSAYVCTALLLKESGRVPNPEAKRQDLAHSHIAWAYIHLQHSGLVCPVQPWVSSRLCDSPVALTRDGFFFSVSKFLLVNAVLQFTKAAVSIS